MLSPEEYEALSEADKNAVCWSCMEVEHVPKGGAFLVCGECWHVYITEDDLIAHYVGEAPDDKTFDAVPDAESIFFCPLCLHDF